MEFYPIKVLHLDKSVEDSVAITLDIPESLKSTFSFKAGQFLTLQAQINGEAIRRSYSLFSSPLDEKWQVGIKKIPGGIFSNFACDNLKVGDTLDVAPPDGKFTIPMQAETKRTIAAFAAGSGITPMVSLIKTFLITEPETNIKLFYTNKRVKTTMLKEALEALKNQFMERLEINYFLTQERREIAFYNGRIDNKKLDQIFSMNGGPSQLDEYFICGPEAMIFQIRDYLTDAGIDEKNIHFELFFSGDANKEVLQELSTANLGKQSKLTIVEGGKEFTIDVNTGSGNVLDYALDKGADLPYACKGGVCCTCRAKLVNGEVKMLKTFGLEQEEIDNNYILTCQAIPLSDELRVDFDMG